MFKGWNDYLNLDDFIQYGYRDCGSPKIEDNFVLTDGYDDMCIEVTQKVIDELKQKYNYSKMFYGYILNLGVCAGDGQYYCDKIKRVYFLIDGKIYTPIQVKGQWYLTEDDMFLTDNIRKTLANGIFDNYYSYISNDTLSTVGILFRQEDEEEDAIFDRMYLLKYPVVENLLDSMGDMGEFIKYALKD